MPSKQQDVAKPNISPVLFMTVDGQPMCFFLRPGPVKRKLQPLISAGAGAVCSVQQPGAILLIDPEERSSIPETSAHRYVSTQFIHDCIEKGEQLNLEDYRLNPEVAPRQSPRLNNSKDRLSGGRAAYTAEEDAAILSHVSKHKAAVGGNRLWQEMEKQGVTSHSWQSMKYRYRIQLAKKHTEVVDVATTEEDTSVAEGETKVDGNQETDVHKTSSASPQTHSKETDLTQIDAQSEPSENEIVEAQTSIPPQAEEKHVNPQTGKQPAESTHIETAEAEASNSPQPDARPIPPESAEPETDEPQTNISPQKESAPEDSPPESLPDTSPRKKTEEKQKASLESEQPQRRVTRRQLAAEMTEPYAKKLRSSTPSPGRPSASPQPSKKSKLILKSPLQTDTVDQPPSKRARGKSVAAVEEPQQEESQQEESQQEETQQEEIQQEEPGEAVVTETAQADTESNSVSHKGGKKKEKRKLGILELATKEFEDDSESDEDSAPDLQTETATTQPTSTEPSVPASNTAADTHTSPQSSPEHEEDTQEPEASSSNCLPEPATTERPTTEPAVTEAVSATSKAHLFIFDSESQVEDSQSVIGDNPVASFKPPPPVNKDAAFSLTQVQLEEDKKRIKELMNETNQDLVSVTKALLRTSGDFSAAREQLLNPSSISGPFWRRCDDTLLTSADPEVRRQLVEKYSEEGVAKRIMFLEVEA